MASTVDVYKHGIKLGSGSIASQGATSITSFTRQAGINAVGTGRNVRVVLTSGNDTGDSWQTRVTNDGDTTLTIAHACPYQTA